jgi:hypothetical protein
MKTKPKETSMSNTTRKDLADAIVSMTYGELVAIGDAMLDAKRSRRLDTAEEFASVLYDWADKQSPR